jgi:hypothetical protein
MNKASIDIRALAMFVQHDTALIQHDKLEAKFGTFGTGNPEIGSAGCNF